MLDILDFFIKLEERLPISFPGSVSRLSTPVDGDPMTTGILLEVDTNGIRLTAVISPKKIWDRRREIDQALDELLLALENQLRAYSINN